MRLHKLFSSNVRSSSSTYGCFDSNSQVSQVVTCLVFKTEVALWMSKHKFWGMNDATDIQNLKIT